MRNFFKSDKKQFVTIMITHALTNEDVCSSSLSKMFVRVSHSRRTRRLTGRKCEARIHTQEVLWSVCESRQSQHSPDSNVDIVARG